MPAATTILMGGATALQAIQGLAAQQKGQQAAATAAINIGRLNQPVVNQLKAVQVPQQGINLAQQNIQAQQADLLRAAQTGGATEVLGATPGLVQQSRIQNQELAAQTADKVYERNMAVAQNEQRIQEDALNRQLSLEQQRLTGAQTAAAAGGQAFSSALGSAAQIAGNIGVSKQLAGLYGSNAGTLGDTSFGQSVNQYSNQLGNMDPFKAVLPPGLSGYYGTKIS